MIRSTALSGRRLLLVSPATSPSAIKHAVGSRPYHHVASLGGVTSFALPFRRIQRCKTVRRHHSVTSMDQHIPLRRSYATKADKTSDVSGAAAKPAKTSRSREDKGKQKSSAVIEDSNNNTTSSPSQVRVTDKRSDGPSRQADIAAREAERARVDGEKQQQQQQQQQQANTSSSTSPSSSPSSPSPAPSPSSSSSPTSSSSSSSPSSQTPSSSSSSSSPPPPPSPPLSASSSELLKQRLQQAQERLERPLPSWGLGISPTSSPVHIDVGDAHVLSATASSQVPHAQQQQNTQQHEQAHHQHQQQQQTSQHPQQVYSPGAQGGSEVPPPHTDSSANNADSAALPSAPIPSMDAINFEPPLPPLDHLFDTRAFVSRLEQAGFLNQERLTELANGTGQPGADSTAETLQRQQSVLEWINRAREGKESSATEQDSGAPPPAMELQTQPNHLPHDPAQAIMELAMQSLRSRSAQTLSHLLNRTQVENQRYLFTAALSELRTELQVRARNDAAALRSITTLLQREVDNLSQRMKEDIEQMKHDIQVDMNNRKGESKEEQNSLEQEIQDLNNRFTISLSDLKTEIEQSIKWDLTRRALALVFGIAAITVISLWIADWLSRRKAAQDAEAANAAAGAQQQQQQQQQQQPVATGGLIKRRSSPTAAARSGTAAQPAPAAPGSTGVTLRPAEDLGLIEQYETDQEGRYV